MTIAEFFQASTAQRATTPCHNNVALTLRVRSLPQTAERTTTPYPASGAVDRASSALLSVRPASGTSATASFRPGFLQSMHPPVQTHRQAHPDRVQWPPEYSRWPHPVTRLQRYIPAEPAHAPCTRLRQRAPGRFSIAYLALHGSQFNGAAASELRKLAIVVAISVLTNATLQTKSV